VPDSFLNDTQLEVGVWLGHGFVLTATKIFRGRKPEKGVGLDIQVRHKIWDGWGVGCSFLRWVWLKYWVGGVYLRVDRVLPVGTGMTRDDVTRTNLQLPSPVIYQ
jgi:hypothetical protein